MKHLLLTTIAAVLLVGCGESQQSTPAPESKPVEPVAEAATPEPPTAEAPDISIHDAAAAGDIDAVKQHIAAGADVNENVLSAPLHAAALNGHKEIAELLIAKGADVDAKDALGNTPLYNTILFNAALDGYKEIAELLIQNSADVNAQDKNGNTPLHEAATSGLKEVVELLIANGADVNAKDNWGGTPLHRAKTKELAELLIEKGADVNAKKKFGRTPLHGAATKGIAELLIAKGADVDGWSWEKAQTIRCVNNLKQIGIATRIYAIDNQDRFSWQVPQSEGGTAEIAQPRSDTDALLDNDGKPIFDVNAWQHFLALSNELSNPKVLRCPNDESRTQANTFQSTPSKWAGSIPFDKNSVSYWLRTDPEVDEARPDEVMVVCPHHDGQYNILFTDSSVLQTDWNRLARYFKDITKPITIAPQ